VALVESGEPKTASDYFPLEDQELTIWVPKEMRFSGDTVKVEAQKSWDGWVLYVPTALV